MSTDVFRNFMMLFTSALKFMFLNTLKYPWFDRELYNVDNYKTKSHKYLKKFETLHVRPMSESDQYLNDTAFHRFRELRRDFKSLHRLKYAQYIVRIEGGLKNNPRGCFKYVGNDCARNSQSIANFCC
jgi:hypothetical protein